MTRKTLFNLVALALGALLLAALIWRLDPAQIWAQLQSFGGNLFIVAAFQLLPIIATGTAWHVLLDGRAEAATLFRCIKGRFIADGVNALLPVAQIGGEVVRARLIQHNGADGAQVSASVVIDLTIGFVALALYIVLGLAGLAVHNHTADFPPELIVGVILFLGLLGLLLLVQKAGLVGKIGARLGFAHLAAHTERFEQQVQAIYARKRILAAACVWRFLGWLLGGVATWLIFALLGVKVTLAEALIIESLVQAARNVAFAVPGGLGIQEGTYVFAALLLGLPPEPALALALIKRGRDLILGLPALLWWHLEESAHLLRRKTKIT